MFNSPAAVRGQQQHYTTQLTTQLTTPQHTPPPQNPSSQQSQQTDPPTTEQPSVAVCYPDGDEQLLLDDEPLSPPFMPNSGGRILPENLKTQQTSSLQRFSLPANNISPPPSPLSPILQFPSSSSPSPSSAISPLPSHRHTHNTSTHSERHAPTPPASPPSASKCYRIPGSWCVYV
eukprot:GHVS01034504.1.p1 GENE.GHVS01034504.1~~GHVS01034504.1.p1  ORF type:complete len:176 (+),score=57.46 GHVS01034504.1:821-1348(+)